MRPAGEIRLALRSAAEQLAALRLAQPVVDDAGVQRVGAHWREIAAQACVGFEAARVVIKNMVKAGDLCGVGEIHVPWSRRPVVLWAPPTFVARPEAPASLDTCMRSWLTH